MPKTSQTTRFERALNVIKGIQKRMSRGPTYGVDGKSYSPKELVAVYQAYLDALDAVRTARAALTVAVANERKIARRMNAFTFVLKSSVRSLFGEHVDVFADFGWKMPKKPGPKTVAAKVAGAEKGRATRKARHTMGSRQRKKIRG